MREWKTYCTEWWLFSDDEVLSELDTCQGDMEVALDNLLNERAAQDGGEEGGGEEGKGLVPVSSSQRMSACFDVGPGLANRGNACYLNSVLQVGEGGREG